MVSKIFSKLFGAAKSPTPAPTPKPEAKPEAKSPPVTVGKPAAPRVGAPDDLKLDAFVSYVVCALVKHPDEVQVTAETDEQGLLIRIKCRQEEVGRIIGKSGKTIRAIRSLVKGAAARQNQKASVIVMED